MARQTRTKPAARRRRTTKSNAVAAPEFADAAEFRALSNAEKERVWQSLDREISDDELRPLTAAERKRWTRVKRKIGRPKIGGGAVPVSVSLERGLLERVDAEARRDGMTRSAYLGRIIEHALAS
jgi:hypothetical protein